MSQLLQLFSESIVTTMRKIVAVVGGLKGLGAFFESIVTTMKKMHIVNSGLKY